MPLLTRQFLQEIGIELDDESYEALAEHFETTLTERVINELVEELDVDQAAQLASMQSSDDESLRQWIVTNVPDLAEIVSDEIDILFGEIAENSEAIDSV